jgi:uncharacterized membrane protein YhaH (DUF805 family)
MHQQKLGRQMFGYLDFLFLSYSGRIGRLTFWVATLVLTLAELGAMWMLALAAKDLLLAAETDPAVREQLFTHFLLPVLIVGVLFLYPTYAIYAKRWHDRDKSGWWSLIGFVPLIGGLWLLIELGFLSGTEGPNAYDN